MLRVCICEDNPRYLDELRRTTHKTLSHSTCAGNFCIDTFSDGLNLIGKMQLGARYDVIMLDWQMPIMSGEITGQEIRELDPDCIIIIVTAYDAFALRAFRLTTFRYIIKTSMKEEIPEALLSSIKQYGKKNHTIMIRTGQDTLVRLYVREISVIEYRQRKVVFKTHKGDYYSTSRMQMNALYAQIREDGFVIPYKGVIVNVAEILEKRPNELVMKDDQIIPVSRANQSKVLAAMIAFMER